MAASFEVIRTLIYSSITNMGYTNVGTPTTQPAKAFRLSNATDGDVTFSIDGANAYFFVPAGSFVLWDVQTNSAPGKHFELPQETQFGVEYVTEPSKKSVYVEVMYSTQPGF